MWVLLAPEDGRGVSVRDYESSIVLQRSRNVGRLVWFGLCFNHLDLIDSILCSQLLEQLLLLVLARTDLLDIVL